MDRFRVRLYGEVHGKARFISLWWDSCRIPEAHEVDLRRALDGLPRESGVYAITGSHNARVGEGVLYIGKAQGLRSRVMRSAWERLIEDFGPTDDKRKLYSDVWDLTVRWSRLSTDLVTDVERLLIQAHVPPFNSAELSAAKRRGGPGRGCFDLVVMNAGRKGPLLPVVAGAYLASWADEENRSMGPGDDGSAVRGRPAAPGVRSRTGTDVGRHSSSAPDETLAGPGGSRAHSQV